MLLSQRMAADRQPPPGGAPGLDGADGAALELAAMVGVVARASSAIERMAAAGHRPRVPWEACHPVPLNPLASSAAGAVSDERWEPREGFAWHVMRVTPKFGAGATAAVMYRDSVAADAWRLNTLSADGVAWEPRGLILLPGQRLIAAGVGGGITVNGDAIEVALDWLPDYLA